MDQSKPTSGQLLDLMLQKMKDAPVPPPGMRITTGEFNLTPEDAETLAELHLAATEVGVQLHRQQDVFGLLLSELRASLGR